MERLVSVGEGLADSGSPAGLCGGGGGSMLCLLLAVALPRALVVRVRHGMRVGMLVGTGCRTEATLCGRRTRRSSRRRRRL